MQSMLLFLLMFALNLVPEDVTSFTMEVDDGKILQFDKQDDGAWVSPEISEETKVSFLLKGLTMTIAAEDKTQTMDLGKELGVDPEIDWDTVKETTIGDLTCKINRLEDGIDIQFERLEEEVETWKVRWKKAESK